MLKSNIAFSTKIVEEKIIERAGDSYFGRFQRKHLKIKNVSLNILQIYLYIIIAHLLQIFSGKFI